MNNKQPFISKPLALLSIAHVVTDLSQGALPVLLPYLKTAFDLTYAQIGVLVLMQNLTSSVIQPVFGFLTDKKSMPWLIPVGILASGLGLATVGMINSYYLLLAAVIVGGIGVASFHPQASKSAHYVSDKTLRGRSMAVFSVGGNLGLALGSIFMIFLLELPGIMDNTIYFALPAIATASLVWLNLPIMSPKSFAPAAATATKSDAPSSLPVLLLLLLLTFIFVRSSIHTGLTTYIPLYYINYLSGDPLYAGYLLSVFLLAGVVGTFIGGVLSDKYGRKTVIMASMATTIPLIPLFQYTSGFVTVILAAVTGAMLISSNATTVVLAQEMMPRYVGMASGLTIGFSIGLGGVGATILGYVADHFGVPSVFTVLSVLPLTGMVMAYFLPGKLSKPDHPSSR